MRHKSFFINSSVLKENDIMLYIYYFFILLFFFSFIFCTPGSIKKQRSYSKITIINPLIDNSLKTRDYIENSCLYQSLCDVVLPLTVTANHIDQSSPDIQQSDIPEKADPFMVCEAIEKPIGKYNLDTVQVERNYVLLSV